MNRHRLITLVGDFDKIRKKSGRHEKKPPRREVAFFLISEVVGGCGCYSYLLTDHHIDDFLIRFFHADAAQAADVADGIFNAFEDETVAAVELLAVTVHFESQNAGIDSG